MATRKAERPSFLPNFLPLRKDRIGVLDKMPAALRWAYLKLLCAASWGDGQEGVLGYFEHAYSVRDIAGLIREGDTPDPGTTARTLKKLQTWSMHNKPLLTKGQTASGVEAWVLPHYAWFTETGSKK